ncbi:MAG: hypothetical protein ACPGYL_01355, partial [Rhodospirillaceae bacterium]
MKASLGSRLRTWFFAGVLVTAPIFITLFVAWTVIEFVDNQVASLLPRVLRDFAVIPGLGLLLLLILLTVIGSFTTGF